MRSANQVSKDFDKLTRKTPQLLLVEDDETDVIFIRRCLASHGSDISITVARDGTEALEILRSEDTIRRPFVILTDLNMPGMSGYELIVEIRADELLQDSVVFVLSSSRLTGDIRRAYQYNVAGYLTKHASADDLKKSISMVFDYCNSVQLLN